MDKEILLSMYDQHRQEIRAHGKRKSRRYLGSLTVLGVVVGYVFTTTGDGRILVLAPYILGFLYLSHISSMHYVAQLAALLALIEIKLNHLGAEYELFHGGFSASGSPRFQDIQDDIEDSRCTDKNKDPQDLHQRMQTYIRYSMRAIALLAYIVPGVMGIHLFRIKEVPTKWKSLLSIFPVSIEMIIFATQLVLLVAIILAWRKYRVHKDLLTARVQQAVEKEEDDIKIRLDDLLKD